MKTNPVLEITLRLNLTTCTRLWLNRFRRESVKQAIEFLVVNEEIQHQKNHPLLTSDEVLDYLSSYHAKDIEPGWRARAAMQIMDYLSEADRLANIQPQRRDGPIPMSGKIAETTKE